MEQFVVTIQGQPLSPDMGLIKRLLAENPGWGRSRLSVRLCELWDWRAANGQLKDMACRSLLLRLERAGQIVLPARQRKSLNGYRNRSPVWVLHRAEPIETALKVLTPLETTCVVNASEQDKLFRCLISSYHYLGWRNTVGENLSPSSTAVTGGPWPACCSVHRPANIAHATPGSAGVRRCVSATCSMWRTTCGFLWGDLHRYLRSIDRPDHSNEAPHK